MGPDSHELPIPAKTREVAHACQSAFSTLLFHKCGMGKCRTNILAVPKLRPTTWPKITRGACSLHNPSVANHGHPQS